VRERCISRIAFSYVAKVHQSSVIIVNSPFVRPYPDNIVRILVQRIDGIMSKTSALLGIMHHVVYRPLLFVEDINPAMVGTYPDLAFSMFYQPFNQAVVQPEWLAVLIVMRDLTALPINMDHTKSVFGTVDPGILIAIDEDIKIIIIGRLYVKLNL